MAIAELLKSYLESAGVPYEVVPHPRTATSSESAQAAHISGECVVKSVVIHHEEGYLLAAVPSTHRIDLGTLRDLAGARLGLAAETEIGEIFSDCDVGGGSSRRRCLWRQGHSRGKRFQPSRSLFRGR